MIGPGRARGKGVRRTATENRWQQMISLQLAQELKAAGLVWQAQNNDFFGIPDRGMDERVFVLSDVMANLELLQGWPAVAFHGAAEWAMDHIYTDEIVWLPTEEQLREALAAALEQRGATDLALQRINVGYRCMFTYHGGVTSYEAPTAGEAYARGLLTVLQSENSTDRV